MSLDRRGVHRCDVRQVLRDSLPALAFVGARPDVAVCRAEVEAHRIETVVVHALADGLERRAFRQTFIEPVPALALVARAVHANAEWRRRALLPVERDAIRGIPFTRMDRG